MATVICRYPEGSERVVDSGVSLEHAKWMPRHQGSSENLMNRVQVLTE